MARNPRTNTDEVAAKLRESQQKLSETLISIYAPQPAFAIA